MRNKFYKAVAIIAAMNMMSFTVFAAGTAESEITADNSPVTESASGNDTPATESEPSENKESVSETTSTPDSNNEQNSTQQPASTPEPPSNSEPASTTEPTSNPESASTTEPTSTTEPASTAEPVSNPEPASSQVAEPAKVTDQAPSSDSNPAPASGGESTSSTDSVPAPASEQKTETSSVTDPIQSEVSEKETDKNTIQETSGKSENSETTSQTSGDATKDDQKTGNNEENETAGDVKDGNTETPAANPENTENKDNESSEELTERRDAQFQEMTEEPESTEEETSNQNESWSNDPVIEDVMGVRAGVDGEDVIIEYKVKHTNEWENIAQGNPLTVTYTDSAGNEVAKQIQIGYGYDLHGENYASIDAKVSKYSDQTDTEIIRMVLPASYFGTTDLQISGGKYTATVSGNGIQSSSPSSAVYTGISMDGTFNDWDAVQKTTLVEPEGQHNVESVAMQIDSDYVYIYIKDDGSNSATWAGPNSNGKYAITTDLGRTLVFQLTQDGAVVGAEGAISNHQGSQWEIAIPTSSLPQNNGGLNFGLYLTESSISGQGNISNVGSSTGIAYDGHYGDWSSFPVTEIQYSTAGTHENVPDGEAAIYVDDNIYGYCTTSMQAHLDETGGEFTQAVSVLANDDWSHALYMRLASVDDAGNIDWNPKKNNLEDGTYEYYIFATDAWGTSQNISSLNDADVVYGKATVTITEGRHDMEWYVDSNKLAARYGIAETDLKTVSSQYGRIGQQLVTSGGASSGPWGGAVLCMLSAAAPFVLKKKFSF